MTDTFSDHDALHQLALAFAAYLEELDQYLQICIRHASTTEVAADDGSLAITKRYRCSMYTSEKLRLPKKIRLVPYAPTVRMRMERNVLTVTVLPAPCLGGLRDHPLRRVGEALLYHEAMMRPAPEAKKIRVRRDKRKHWPLQAFLLQAMKGIRVPPKSAFQQWLRL